MSLRAPAVITARLLVAFDCNCGQARRALNQLKFLGRGAARNAAVHLQRSKEFVVLSKYTGGTESVQAKMLCVRGDGGEIGCIVLWKGNERNDVANIAIENAADLIQDLCDGRTG